MQLLIKKYLNLQIQMFEGTTEEIHALRFEDWIEALFRAK